MLPRLCSPQAGEPLWTGQVAGEPFKSVSITAEAGKVPTFNVRLFWPFQVAELGLWKEGENKRGVEAGLPHVFRSQVVCHGAASAWRKESLFLPNTKGLCGHAPASRPGLVERSGNEAED